MCFIISASHAAKQLGWLPVDDRDRITLLNQVFEITARLIWPPEVDNGKHLNRGGVQLLTRKDTCSPSHNKSGAVFCRSQKLNLNEYSMCVVETAFSKYRLKHTVCRNLSVQHEEATNVSES